MSERWSDDGEAKPSDERERESEQHLLQRHPGVLGEQRAVVPQRVGDVARGRDQEGLDVSASASTSHWAASSQSTEQGDDHRGGQPASASSRPPGERLERPLARRGELGRGDRLEPRRRARAGERELADEPRRAGAEHRDAVGEVERLLDVVGDEQRGRRLARRAPPASHSCISARVIASSEANGSSSSSTGLPASSVRRKATRWRMPPESSSGRDDSKPASPKRSNRGARLGAGVARARRRGCAAPARRCRSPTATAAAGRAGACRRSARAARGRGARRRRDRAGARLEQAGDQLEQGRLAAARRADDADDLARGDLEVDALEHLELAEGVGEPGDLDRRVLRPQLFEAPRREPRLLLSCSLRAHYRTGSKGQRRGRSERYLSPLAREPPWVVAGSVVPAGWAGPRRRVGGSTRATKSSTMRPASPTSTSTACLRVRSGSGRHRELRSRLGGPRRRR